MTSITMKTMFNLSSNQINATKTNNEILTTPIKFIQYLTSKSGKGIVRKDMFIHC